MSEVKATEMPDFSKVFKVYSGRPGCMCGCSGKYSHPTDKVEFAGKERGYELSEDEISDRSVKIIFNKIKKALEEGCNVVTLDTPFGAQKVNYVFFETKTRYYAVYFTP